MGKSATDKPTSTPSLALITLTSSMSKTTLTSTVAKRGTSSKRSFSSRKRMARPSPTSSVNSTTPENSRVSRNANAISTGMNVPKVCMPTTLRASTMTSAPMGMSSSTL